MIKDKLENLHRYSINENFEDIKKKIGLGKSLPVDQPDSVKKINLKYFTKDLDYKNFENHKKYIDLHIILEGSEKIGLNYVEDLKPLTDYDEVQDFQLFQGVSKEELILHKEEFILLFPGEVHITGGKIKESEEITKIVYKIPFD